jgi:hypothetical protein
MPNLQTWEQAKRTRTAVRKDTFEGHITDFIATHQTRQPGAQAFLVEQDPNWVTPPHYHGEHQFQIIMAGHGSIGRHRVGPLSVHYAAPETGYGPIAAGSEGIAYLTLRPSGDTGAWYLHKPGSRERMQPGLKREQQHGAPHGSADAQELAALTGVAEEVLLEPRADGLAAHRVRMGPGQCHAAPSAHAHGGRFYVVTQGSVEIDGTMAPGLAVAFAGADERATLRAGPAGAEVLVMQFPVQARPMARSRDGLATP